MHGNKKKKGMAKGGAMMKKKGYAKGGKTAMKKKGYAKGGKTAMKKKGYSKGGALKKPEAKDAGLKKLPKSVRNKMGYMKDGGKTKKKGYAMGGPTTPMEGEQSRYRPSANRAPQGMMSARGTPSAMGMAKGGKTGYANCGASMKATQSGTPKK